MLCIDVKSMNKKIFIGIGILTAFNFCFLLSSYAHVQYADIKSDFPQLFYGCFVLFYTQSCIEFLYFSYLTIIISTDYILGMKCNHKPFDPNTIALNDQITSESDPLKVDFINVAPFQIIGMTILPGRTKGKFNRNLIADIKRLKNELKVKLLVTLTPTDELIRCEAADILEIAENNGLKTEHFPWRDKYIPNNMRSFHFFVCRLEQCFNANYKMVVHCNGGVGRTGPTVACLLMKLLKENF